MIVDYYAKDIKPHSFPAGFEPFAAWQQFILLIG